MNGGCPVKHGSNNHNFNYNKDDIDHQDPKNNKSLLMRYWPSIWSKAKTKTDIEQDMTSMKPKSATSTSSMNECPVLHGSSNSNSINNGNKNLPPSIEEAARHPQSPLPDQRIPLSTHRVISTIPRMDESSYNNSNSDSDKPPHHQPSDTSTNRWVYPSEQQFYNAMRRKGYTVDDESTIPFVVRIHNAVNERGWRDIRKWEEMRGNANPRLVKFLGRPKDLSPRAWIYSRLFMKKEPFDRHDWYVDDGTTIHGTDTNTDTDNPAKLRRYVIDFYAGEEKDGGLVGGGLLQRETNPNENDNNTITPSTTNTTTSPTPSLVSNRPPSMYLDVRPALDDFDSAYDRFRMGFRDTFPGIYQEFFGKK